MKFSKQTYQHLRQALREDLGRGDLTSRLLIPAKQKAKAVVIARDQGIFCGTEVFRFIFHELDSRMKLRFSVKEGRAYRKNQALVQLEGNLRAMLAAERTALNLIGRLSGTATLTARFVQAVRPCGVKILDTRKTTPLWRELEKYAVVTGGGKNHRMGLYDAVFVKENHRVYSDLNRLKKYAGKFEIEVRHEKELNEALSLAPRVILFDNFSPPALKKAVQKVRSKKRKKVILEASGGIGLKNIKDYAKTGVDWISCGALTHSSPSANFSLLIKK